MTLPSFSSDPYNPDHLIAGDHKLVTREVTLTESQAQGALLRGAVLGEAAGVYARVHQTGTYPATTAKAVLAVDADPSGGDIVVLVYIAGQFNEDQLSFGGTVDKDDCREPLQENSVYIRDPQTSDAAS